MKLILDTLFDNENDDMKIIYGADTIAESSTVIIYMINNYYDFTAAMPDRDEFATVNWFVIMWQNYVSENAENLSKALAALDSEYDPISNYDMIETAADGKRKDKNKVSNTPYGQILTETTTDITGFNSSGTGVNADFVQNRQFYQNDDGGNMAHTETEEEPTNNQIMTFDGTTKTGYHEAEEHYLKRSGNIGVTTSQQMIQSEIELRKQNLIYEFIDRFVKRYCYYAG